MTTIHLLRSGEWSVCDGRSCATDLCLGVSLEEARKLPVPMLEALIAAVEPVPRTRVLHNPYKKNGKHALRNSQVTEWLDSEGASHRDFKLPARIWDTGVSEYWEHGRYLYSVGTDKDADRVL